LGNGDGNFAAPLIPNLDSADGINAFGVGDFNGDGITDLLVDDEDTAKLTVLLGKGDGTFTVGQSMSFNTQSIAIADFNGDGKLDLALSGSAQTTILLGNGDGTFTAAPNQPQIGSSQVAAADFNGDGKLDLAVSPSNGATSILLGNDDGTFTATSNQPQITTDQLVAADFNGDGKIDLAALDLMGDTVTIVLGNGDGTFSAESTFPTGSKAFSLAVGDFNGDGEPDIAVAGVATFPDHKVTIYTGNGDGTFAAGFDINDASAQSLIAADFTGSGTSDLATLGSVLLGNLTISTATNDIDLPAGFVVIQADYPGDASNAPSNSTNKPGILVPQQLFSLSSNPVTVAPGASAGGSFSVTSSGFSGTLNLRRLHRQRRPELCRFGRSHGSSRCTHVLGHGSSGGHRSRAGYRHAYCEHHCRSGCCLQPTRGSHTTSSARRCDRRLGGCHGVAALVWIPHPAAENDHAAWSAADRNLDRRSDRVRRGEGRCPTGYSGQSWHHTGRVYRHSHGFQWCDHGHHRRYRDRELSVIAVRPRSILWSRGATSKSIHAFLDLFMFLRNKRSGS
jgi:hypothetical protein